MPRFVRPAKAALLGLGLAIASGIAPARAEICKVTDPTGTPLNLRAAPNGAVVGTIRNGIDVEILDVSLDSRGRRWTLIRPEGSGPAVGWVFREFLSCYR